MFSSCAIHHEFPFICFVPDCVKGQFDMKPLKKKMQIALGGKKRKLKMSLTTSKSKKKQASYSKSYDPKKPSITARDSAIIDSVIAEELSGSFTVLDTVIRINYQDLTDSVLNKHKLFIKAFIKRTGTMHISEISLTDFYAVDGYTTKSIKSDIEDYIMHNGVSKHRLFWRKNKRIKLGDSFKKPKNLLYLEIHFY